MKSGVKSIRNLLVPIIILLLLVFGLIAVNYWAPGKAPETDQTEEPQIINVVSLSVDNILLISVEKSEGEGYKIICETSETDEKRWSYEDSSNQYSDGCFSDELLERYIQEVSSVAAVKSFEADNSELSEYGLETPAIEVTYTLLSGGVMRVQVGANSIDGKSAYVRVDSKGPVYVVPVEKAETFDASAMDFFDRKVLDYSARSISSIRFSRRSDDLDVTAYPEITTSSLGDTSNWRLVEPIDYRSGEVFDRVATSVLTLEIDEYITDSAIELAQYGLESPEYLFEIEERDGNITHAYLSREMSGKYYGYTDAIPGIFRISSDRISDLDVSLVLCYDSFPVQATVDEIKSVKAVFPEGEFLLEMDIPEGIPFEDPESSVFLNHRSAKVTDQYNNSYFMFLYASIMEIRFAKVMDDAKSPDGITISIQVVRKNNQITMIEFSPEGDDFFAVFLDGDYTGFLVSSDELYSEDLSEPGVWYAYELLNQALDGQINGKYDIPVS